MPESLSHPVSVAIARGTPGGTSCWDDGGPGGASRWDDGGWGHPRPEGGGGEPVPLSSRAVWVALAGETTPAWQQSLSHPAGQCC